MQMHKTSVVNKAPRQVHTASSCRVIARQSRVERLIRSISAFRRTADGVSNFKKNTRVESSPLARIFVTRSRRQSQRIRSAEIRLHDQTQVNACVWHLDNTDDRRRTGGDRRSVPLGCERAFLIPLLPDGSDCGGVTGCAVAIYCGAHFHRIVCGGLHRMGRKFEEVATTLDLSKRSSSPRMDEFGRAAVAFDKLMRRVEETMSAVHVSADSVTISTRGIAAGNLDLSTRTEEQAASLEETAAI